MLDSRGDEMALLGNLQSRSAGWGRLAGMSNLGWDYYFLYRRTYGLEQVRGGGVSICQSVDTGIPFLQNHLRSRQGVSLSQPVMFGESLTVCQRKEKS